MIFDNLGCDSYLIINEIGKFNVKVSVIRGELEKYVAFTINNNLVSIDCMQFMNYSPDIFVTKLSDNDFKYSSQEFSNDLLEFVWICGQF